MNRRTAVIFYILSIYVIVQFLWWGFHLIQLTHEVTHVDDLIRKRITMVIGEGIVFIVIVMIGLWQIRKSIKRQISLERKQKNFLLSVTHELKTPLAANKLYLQTIMKRDLEKTKQHELLESALKENSRLGQMIDNILNASRLENNVIPLNREKVDIKEIATDLIRRFSILTEKELNLELHGDLVVQADPFLLEATLSNLIDNAIKYGGGEITIYSREAGDDIELGVKDDGNGVPKEIQKDIFQKFFRGGDEETRSAKGTGLGLFIISEIVRLHGGKIVYRDNHPKGANFMVTINKI